MLLTANLRASATTAAGLKAQVSAAANVSCTASSYLRAGCRHVNPQPLSPLRLHWDQSLRARQPRPPPRPPPQRLAEQHWLQEAAERQQALLYQRPWTLRWKASSRHCRPLAQRQQLLGQCWRLQMPGPDACPPWGAPWSGQGQLPAAAGAPQAAASPPFCRVLLWWAGALMLRLCAVHTFIEQQWPASAVPGCNWVGLWSTNRRHLAQRHQK